MATTQRSELDERLSSDQMRAELQRLRARVAELENQPQSRLEDQNLLRSILEHSPDRIYFKDLESRFTRVSESVAQLFGLDAQEMIGRTDAEVFTPEHAAETRADELAIIASGKPLVGRIEIEHYPDDGTQLYISTTKLPLCDLDGNVIGTFGISRDITELKQTRQALRDNEAIYKSLIDSIGQNIFRKDLQGRVTFCNRQYCQTLLMKESELLGKTDYDLFPKDLADKYLEDDRQVIETGQPFETVEEHRRPDGEKLYVQVIKTPVRDAQENVVGVQVMFWDVTEKWKAQEAVNQLAAIVQCSDDAIIGTDLTGKIATWNPGAERLYGYSACDAIGQNIRMLVPRSDVQEVDAIIWQIQQGETISQYETSRVRQDGTLVEVALNVSPLRNNHGEVVGVAGIARDISMRKRAEQAVHHLAAIVESSPDAIISCTPDGTIEHWNQAAESIYGYRFDEVRGRSIVMLFPGENQQDCYALLGRALQGERLRDLPTQQQMRDGKLRNMTITLIPILHAGEEKVLGIAFVSRLTGADALTSEPTAASG